MRCILCIALAVDLFSIAASIPTTHHSKRRTEEVQLLTDLVAISQYWGEISPYSDNAENYFGVEDVGLPSGCQVEQAHLLQRHANRFPTGYVASSAR